MITDVGVIACAIITTVGMILGVYVLDKKWYKREIHKTQMDFVRKENSIKLKKLERELGLKQPNKTTTATPSGDGSITSILPSLLKALSPDQVRDFAGMMMGESAEGSEPEGLADKLISAVEEHPELIRQFKPILDGYLQRMQGNTTTESGGEGGFI